MKVLEPEKIK